MPLTVEQPLSPTLHFPDAASFLWHASNRPHNQIPAMCSWQEDQSDVSCEGHDNRRHETPSWPSPDDIGFDHLGKVISAYFCDMKLLCLHW